MAIVKSNQMQAGRKYYFKHGTSPIPSVDGMYMFLGFTDVDVKYGEGGAKFKNLKEVFNKFGVKSLKELENIDKKLGLEYGHGVYMEVAGMSDEGEYTRGPFYYLYNGKWSWGSGAGPIKILSSKPTGGE